LKRPSEKLPEYGEEYGVIPSAKIPASLSVDPHVRKCASDEGMVVSENVIWMLVVAVQEHVKNVMRKMIVIAREINDGFASELPQSNAATSINSEYKPPVFNMDENLRSSASRNQGKSIGVAEFALLLAADPLIVGTCATSRMSWMRSSFVERRRVDHGSLCEVNNLIDASIRKPITNNDGYTKQVSKTVQPLEVKNCSNIALQPRKNQQSSETK